MIFHMITENFPGGGRDKVTEDQSSQEDATSGEHECHPVFYANLLNSCRDLDQKMPNQLPVTASVAKTSE